LIELPRPLAAALLQHADEAAPEEACGFVVLLGQRVVRIERTRNASATPTVHFTFDQRGYQRIVQVEKEERERAGRDVDIGIYHSHPASPARPSATDVREMRQAWPDALQLLLGFGEDPAAGRVIRAYRIDWGGAVTPQPLHLTDGPADASGDAPAGGDC
jgi:proteasome lid subunit RPN8/RPN11